MAILRDDRGWVLQTARAAYALGVSEAGQIIHRYWGARLPLTEDYPLPPESQGWASFSGPGQVLPEEYPAYAGAKYIEPCLKLIYADGVRDAVLRFERVEVTEDLLSIHLRDDHYPLHITLHYRLHVPYDLIERWASVSNDGDASITLERVFSAQWHLPAHTRYRLTHLSGRWYDEWHIHRDWLPHGVTRLDSRRGMTGHHHNPWFALDDGAASEDGGEIWFGTLGWSGNWALTAEVTDFGTTRIGQGINDWDFAWQLAAGETFTTPPAYGGWTAGGYGAASRALHDFARDIVLPHGKTIHKVLYNSWEATLFDVDEPSQVELAEIAADMGVELFVLDDGWFKGRVWDNAALGDWTPDARKFPHGLMPLIERVNALGMDFGLWLEPESVNPDSDLYRAHPEWVIHFPTRARTPMRNQYLLNLARRDVQDYLIDAIDLLLRDHNIAFIKWDVNRNVSEPGWPDAPRDQRELWVRYVLGLYRVWGTLRERFPQVVWQSCSGGGGRADLGILRHADQVWISDNTEATARLAMQEGFSLAFPAHVMEAWVTDMGRAHLPDDPQMMAAWMANEMGRGHVPLEFRFHVSMCGALGVGGNLRKWTHEERATAARSIATYKQIREIVQLGDQFRLLSAQGNGMSAVQYMRKDQSEGVLFAFRVWQPDPALLPPIKLRGLIADARYDIEGEEAARSGLAWMRDGLRLPLGNLESALRRIRRVG